MPDYRTMYFELAARVADAVELLQQAQLAGEEHYLAGPAPPVALPVAAPATSGNKAEEKLSIKRKKEKR